MNPIFMQLLDTLREKMGEPLVLSSAYRCPIYNNYISGSGLNGPHTTGHAVDILIQKAETYALLAIVFDMKVFTGIGVSQKGVSRFIHIDDLRAPAFPRPTVWSY